MRDDKETKTIVRFNKRKVKRQRAVQNVLIEGKGVKLDELGDAIAKSVQPS
jgi:hypothetical protein